MGCVLGSFGFDLVVQDIYEAVKKAFPEIVLRALTDDCNSAVPPQDDLQEQLKLCGEVFAATRDQALQIAGLRVNMDKSCVLLPLDPEGKEFEVNLHDLPEGYPPGLRITTEGLKVGGAPIGTDDFIRNFTHEALLNFRERLEALPGIDAQVGFGLLRMCVATAPTFLAQVTPPLLTADLFREFDTAMENCALAILTLPGQDPPSCSVERLDRAKRRLRLPLRHKGAGLSSVAERHAIAYFSSVVSCAAVDDELAWNIDGLQRFASDTHARVLARLGPANELTTNVEDIICRSDPVAMLNTGYFAEMFTEAAPKLSASLAHAVQAVAAQSLQDDLQARADGSFCTESDLTAACSHGDLQLVLTAKLSDKYNRLEPQDFVAWMRVFLQLPPLQRLMNAQPTVGFDYDIERCMGDHATGNDALLDLHGGHDNSNCAPTSQGKHAGHNMYKWTLHRFARRVPGVEVKVEPKTHEILLNQFSEDSSRSCPPGRGPGPSSSWSTSWIESKRCRPPRHAPLPSARWCRKWTN
jgi:hypothetical protein